MCAAVLPEGVWFASRCAASIFCIVIKIFRTHEVCCCFHWRLRAAPSLISQVAGIKGMFLANKKTDNQVKTHITYNRGRDWRLLQAPSKDLRANSIHCVLVSVCQCAAFVRVFIRRAPFSRGGLDRNWMNPATNEQCPSKLTALMRLSWKVSYFSSVQWTDLSFKEQWEEEVSGRKAFFISPSAQKVFNSGVLLCISSA